MAETSSDWIVMGGAIGETAHCRRCGEGLIVVTPPAAFVHNGLLGGVLLSSAARTAGCRIGVFVGAAKAFAEEHASCVEHGYVEPTPSSPAEWLQGRDVGVSAATICFAAFGIKSPFDREDVPHDASDFGRCYRFLNLFPAARRGVNDLGTFQERWIGLANAWDRLSAMYASGDYETLNAEIERLSRG